MPGSADNDIISGPYTNSLQQQVIFTQNALTPNVPHSIIYTHLLKHKQLHKNKSVFLMALKLWNFSKLLKFYHNWSQIKSIPTVNQHWMEEWLFVKTLRHHERWIIRLNSSSSVIVYKCDNFEFNLFLVKNINHLHIVRGYCITHKFICLNCNYFFRLHNTYRNTMKNQKHLIYASKNRKQVLSRWFYES